MNIFEQAFPGYDSAKYLDKICNDLEYNQFARKKLANAIQTSFKLFKSVSNINKKFREHVLVLCYKDKIKYIDSMNEPKRIKDNLKNIIHISFNKYLKKINNKK